MVGETQLGSETEEFYPPSQMSMYQDKQFVWIKNTKRKIEVQGHTLLGRSGTGEISKWHFTWGDGLE